MHLNNLVSLSCFSPSWIPLRVHCQLWQWLIALYGWPQHSLFSEWHFLSTSLCKEWGSGETESRVSQCWTLLLSHPKPVPWPSNCFSCSKEQTLIPGLGNVGCCCSVAKSCMTPCNLMDCSTQGFPVLLYLPEFAQTQTHVYWVSGAIQPSHPMWPPSPPALNLSQYQEENWNYY